MCMYICIYPSASYIHTISIPISTYLPTYQAFLHRSPFLILPPSPARACACVCMYSVYIYELIEGFSSLSCSAPKKKKETLKSFASLRRLRPLPPPPSPCDGSSHIQSQLDKTRQATCLSAYLPACKRIKKKNKNPPIRKCHDAKQPSMDYYRGGWPVCLSV